MENLPNRIKVLPKKVEQLLPKKPSNAFLQICAYLDRAKKLVKNMMNSSTFFFQLKLAFLKVLDGQWSCLCLQSGPFRHVMSEVRILNSTNYYIEHLHTVNFM